ncbi:ParB/Srx family N-terminal domain-containing protein [Bradyrhizobium sp. Leo121]|uniref:ParB/Srx family N-terminal domain-containing protein n=1 Tax=Bradyrhizobium sp. Leo121 TaxID=1571195 RepID=UPI0032E49D2B
MEDPRWHRKLNLAYQQTSALKPRSNNPRTHSKKQIAQIEKAIRRFGFTNPVLVDDRNGVIAGHGRLEAAKSIGLSEVPTVRLSDLTEADIRAYVIADNRLAENAGWDRNLLGLELKYLSELEIDFDVSITGFELPEIDILIGEAATTTDAGEADEPPLPAEGPAVTRPGDLWKIGAHRLICGDSTKLETYQALLGTERAQMVFSDPPYNVPIAGHVCGLGEIQHREFAMASGEMSEAEFTAFLASVFRHLAAHSVDGAIHFQCIDWRHIGQMLAPAVALTAS